MGESTNISWVADPATGAKGRTWNPVTGCDRISAGCDNCYALTLAARLKAMGAKRYVNDGDPATSGRANSDETLGTLADLRRAAAHLRADPAELLRTAETFPLLRSRVLPDDVRGAGQIDLPDEGWLGEIFDQAMDLLTALAGGGGEAGK